MTFENYQLAVIGVVAVAIAYTLFIKPYLKRIGMLTLEQIEFIDYAVETGVQFAEQLYKTDNTIDRHKIALDYAFDVLRKSGMIPEDYIDIIRGIVESKVLILPKTHPTAHCIDNL